MASAALEAVPVESKTGKRDFRYAAGKEFMQTVKDALAEAGLPRISNYNGGELTGWTWHYGATGFSVSTTSRWHDEMPELPEDSLMFHVVISGKIAGLEYADRREVWGDDEYEGYEPLRPESLGDRIKAVFTELGLKVICVKHSGHSTGYDDDVYYNVFTECPTA